MALIVATDEAQLLVPKSRDSDHVTRFYSDYGDFPAIPNTLCGNQNFTFLVSRTTHKMAQTDLIAVEHLLTVKWS